MNKNVSFQKYIDTFNMPCRFSSDNRYVKSASAVIIIDTVYLSERSFGVMIARDVHKKKTIDRIYISTETIGHFRSLVKRLQKRGVTIKALVLDGRPGMIASYTDIPTQMCHFHQIQIVTRYEPYDQSLRQENNLVASCFFCQLPRKDYF